MAEVPGSVQYSSGGSQMGMFDGALGGIAGGVLGFLAADETNRSNRQLAQYQNEQSAAEAQRNRDWQERMSNTAYQRSVKDLSAAGLNPMMAYGSMGSSTPSGAVGAMAQAAPAVSPIGAALEGWNRSRDVGSNVLERESRVDVNKQQEALTNAGIEKAKQETATSAAAELDYKAGALQKASQARLNSATEAAQRAQAYKTTEEGRFVASQRAEQEAKSPLWNIIHSATKKIKDISESSTAENVKRMRENIPRYEIIGNPGVYKK